MTGRPTTLAELRASGWRDRSVKEELRENLVAALRAGRELFPGVVGFEETVLPSLERALLAGHDLVLLGERGQAKTRLIRGLVGLLDPELPVVAGCEVNDSPERPICARCRRILEEEAGATPVEWVDRRRRYAEKLATPDVSVADLIGDVDPIKVAEGRYLSDELTIHFGLVPRTHRGIFAINELPDLPARIQVALFNILEERDVQIRGFQVRLPLDLLLVASANPEDYTNRGRIITPLKDRFGSEVRTHYPRRIEEEIWIMDQEASPPVPEVAAVVPPFMKEILAEFTRQARRSPHVDQRSGVSVRLSIANLETLTASAVRRALRAGEAEAVPRIADLPAVLQSSTGRMEFETFEEGREEEVLARLLDQAVLEVFRRRLAEADYSGLLRPFREEGLVVETGDLVPASRLLEHFGESPHADRLLELLGIGHPTPGLAAAALEFALEGLHLSRRLNKSSTAGGAAYRAPPGREEPGT